MFTVCTNCKTKFRVSAVQLKAAEGKVRCGKCHEIFDAFWNLEDADAESQSMKASEKPATTPNLGMVSSEAGPAPELDTVIKANDEALAETPTLRVGPRRVAIPPIDDLFGSLAHPSNGKSVIESEAQAASEMPEVEVNAQIGSETHLEVPEDYPIPAEDLPQHPAPPPRRTAASALWWSGIMVMALVLTLQLVNADRDALAQNPVIGPTLQALYAAMGQPIPPPRSVRAWVVSDLNVTSDPQTPGELSITGTLQNQAGFAQPWPYLRIQLTDRFGEPLRGRDFRPADYLPATEASALLAGDQAVRFRIDVADPGADAVGFTLSPCLDVTVGRVCAASDRD